METSALVATTDLFIKTDQELAKTIFEHKITGNRLSMFNSNGKIRKCQKFKILQKIHLKCVDYSKYIAVVDMGLLWRLSTPSSAGREKCDGTVYTWKDYRHKVFETMFRKHCSASMNIAAIDCYGNDVINVKGGERQKHSTAYVGGQTKNLFPAKERHFPGIKEFNSFFSESIEQNLFAGFPEVTFHTEMQTNK